jgi:cell division topological specificity factor
MFESIANFFKKLMKSEAKETTHSKDTAKERLHLVLMQDRANVSADFLELMKQEIIEVIKKYIEIEESAIDVRLTNEIAEDGTKGAPSLYANIPIVNIKNNIKKEENKEENKKEENKESKEEQKEEKTKEKEEDKEEEKNGQVEQKDELKKEEERTEPKEKNKSINEVKKEQTNKNIQNKKSSSKNVKNKAT